VTKKRTFLYYISDTSLYFKISFTIKFLGLIVLSSFAILNHLHAFNWIVGLIIVLFLAQMGFLKNGFTYLKVIFYSLTVFCAVWFLFSRVPGDHEYIKYPWGSFVSNNTIQYVLLAVSKWFLLCLSGLFFLVISSQEELIEDLIYYKAPHQIILVATIGFNTIAFILESLSDISYALESRDFSRNSILSSFYRVVYIACAVIMSNIKRISMLRIAYFLDMNDIQRLFGK